MAKAGTPKKAKPKPKLTDKDQSERFIETAREIGVDESGKEFDRAIGRLINQKSIVRGVVTKERS
jgi:hypothetical protein